MKRLAAHESCCEEHVNDLGLSHFNLKGSNIQKKKQIPFFLLSRVAITVATRD